MHPTSKGDFCDNIKLKNVNRGRGRGGLHKATHSKVYIA